MKKGKKFKAPKFKKHCTIGEVYGPAMKITDPEEAKVYFEALVKHILAMKPENEPRITSRDKAEEIVRKNLGYYSGYYDHETMKRVFKLFDCAHPIFGTTIPTPEAAFEVGKKMGEAAKKSKKLNWDGGGSGDCD